MKDCLFIDGHFRIGNSGCLRDPEAKAENRNGKSYNFWKGYSSRENFRSDESRIINNHWVNELFLQ